MPLISPSLVSTQWFKPPVFQTGALQREESGAILKRQALRVLSQIPPRLVDEVPLPSSQRSIARPRPGHLPTGLCGEWRRDHQRCFVYRSRPYVRVSPAETGSQRSGSDYEGQVVSQNPAGIPTDQKTLLGSPFLGTRVFLNNQRRHYGRHRTSVPRTAYR